VSREKHRGWDQKKSWGILKKSGNVPAVAREGSLLELGKEPENEGIARGSGYENFQDKTPLIRGGAAGGI